MTCVTRNPQTATPFRRHRYLGHCTTVYLSKPRLISHESVDTPSSYAILNGKDTIIYLRYTLRLSVRVSIIHVCSTFLVDNCGYDYSVINHT